MQVNTTTTETFEITGISEILGAEHVSISNEGHRVTKVVFEREITDEPSEDTGEPLSELLTINLYGYNLNKDGSDDKRMGFGLVIHRFQLERCAFELAMAERLEEVKGSLAAPFIRYAEKNLERAKIRHEERKENIKRLSQ